MPFGIQNATAVTFDNITEIINSSSIPELTVKINNDIFGGWYYFIMLWVLWFILFWAANQNNNQILHNAMYSGSAVTVISIFLRVIEIDRSGVVQGLLTDFQMWTFPLLTIVIAAAVWMTR